MQHRTSITLDHQQIAVSMTIDGCLYPWRDAVSSLMSHFDDVLEAERQQEITQRHIPAPRNQDGRLTRQSPQCRDMQVVFAFIGDKDQVGVLRIRPLDSWVFRTPLAAIGRALPPGIGQDMLACHFNSQTGMTYIAQVHTHLLQTEQCSGRA